MRRLDGMHSPSAMWLAAGQISIPSSPHTGSVNAPVASSQQDRDQPHDFSGQVVKGTKPSGQVGTLSAQPDGIRTGFWRKHVATHTPWSVEAQALEPPVLEPPVPEEPPAPEPPVGVGPPVLLAGGLNCWLHPPASRPTTKTESAMLIAWLMGPVR